MKGTNSVMMRLKFQSFTSCILILLLTINAFSQKRNQAFLCPTKAFTALPPLPELNYGCPEGVIESSDSILNLPERINAINEILKNLESYSSAVWWNTPVNDLNACYLRGKPGALTSEERQQFTDEEYQVRLMGNSQIRLVLVSDPCYQTYYNGANIFLLYRKGTKVYPMKAIDGYFSRLAKSVFLKTYRLGKDQIIEIETANISGMRPVYWNYYFAINKTNNKLVRGELVKKGRRLVFRPFMER
jgi:hypothetical protein